jgi:hypothetical protein
MAPAVLPDRRLTYDDFRLFPDDARLRHEIIGNFLATHPDIGRVFLAPVDVVLSFHDIAAPDFVFEASNQLAIMTEKNADEGSSLWTGRPTPRHSQVALTGAIPRTLRPSRPPSPMSVARTDIR